MFALRAYPKQGIYLFIGQVDAVWGGAIEFFYCIPRLPVEYEGQGIPLSYIYVCVYLAHQV